MSGDPKSTDKAFHGRITSGLKKDTLIEGVYNFIRTQISEWRDDPTRPFEESEEKLNSQLCKFLDSKARVHFPMIRFDHEEFQFKTRRSDLSASLAENAIIEAMLHTIYDPVLVIECKRLPAPTADREMEYISGGDKKTGGIQRFKLGLHGAKLSHASIVGYIQAKDFDFWNQKINGWISSMKAKRQADETEWDDKDLLIQVSVDVNKRVSEQQSNHSRLGTLNLPTISIQHFWIKMN